ncbi:uncharacterized protein SPAPADRAFT_63469 [Spathaspora passalidarum NRRL Y-27907]|uniref:Uncharacterized protein n=1 Tax=Spathaspora passalidarum (strain NRRL Y-27907 / 11-Y1) TaxID=619300 RepID=G3AUZ4_SPAPN|nr:uncharacterized protein SPAPADRAFT_63469 [Spathaspora passalidarum NRRL Y-27907]EGW29851.1 hypothetical protein SPAPADRAFT_63469 [Spathaspora passalidarum NRRL Y-27907]
MAFALRLISKCYRDLYPWEGTNKDVAQLDYFSDCSRVNAMPDPPGTCMFESAACHESFIFASQ